MKKQIPVVGNTCDCSHEDHERKTNELSQAGRFCRAQSSSSHFTHQFVGELDGDEWRPWEVGGQLGQRLHFDGDEGAAGWDRVAFVGSSFSNPGEEANVLREKNNNGCFSSYTTTKDHSISFSHSSRVISLGQQGLAPKGPTGPEAWAPKHREQLWTPGDWSPRSSFTLCLFAKLYKPCWKCLRELERILWRDLKNTLSKVRRKLSGVSGWLIKQTLQCVRHRQNAHKHRHRNVFRSNL